VIERIGSQILVRFTKGKSCLIQKSQAKEGIWDKNSEICSKR